MKQLKLMSSNKSSSLWRLKKVSDDTGLHKEYSSNSVCLIPSAEGQGRGTPGFDQLLNWTSAKGVRISSPTLYSLHHKWWLWSFYHPRNSGSAPHSLARHAGWFPKDTGINTILMLLTLRILETLSHSKHFWENPKCFIDTETWAENGDPAGRTSAGYVHASLTLEKSAASGRAHPNHNSAPQETDFCHCMPWGCGPLENKWLHRSSLSPEIPRIPYLGKRRDSWDSKEWRFKFYHIFQV